jgi:hypothetical protein
VEERVSELEDKIQIKEKKTEEILMTEIKHWFRVKGWKNIYQANGP